MDLRQHLSDAYADLAKTLQKLKDAEEKLKDAEEKLKNLQSENDKLMTMLFKIKLVEWELDTTENKK